MTMTLDGSNANTVGVPNSGTAQNSTSGTAITFTGIPAGTKRITVMFNGVSTSGTSSFLIQIGAGSVLTSGYVGSNARGTTYAYNSAGFILVNGPTASQTYSGMQVLGLVGSNTWTGHGTLGSNSADGVYINAGSVALSGTLDRVRITTVNGTDTFDAGSINILYE